MGDTQCDKNDAHLCQLTGDGWVGKDLNFERNRDTRPRLGAFHCWKGMALAVSPSLDGPARWRLDSRQALITLPCKRPFLV
jgi:hypothetical protein